METSVKDSYSRVLQHLANDSSDADKALGGLTIALMCEEGTLPQEPSTATEIRESLFAALMNENAQVKVNAFLAISALTNMCEVFTAGATAENISTLVERIPRNLNTDAPQDAAKAVTNGLACVAAFARLEQDFYKPIARALLDNDAVSVALQYVNAPVPTLRAAACDAICALSSNALADFRTPAVAQGMTTSMMSSVTTYLAAAGHMHANLLCLLGVGMLIVVDEAAQECIASSSLDVGTLLGCMRRHDDSDIQILASDIFAVLVKNQKDKVAQTMRYAQKNMDANLKYTK